MNDRSETISRISANKGGADMVCFQYYWRGVAASRVMPAIILGLAVGFSPDRVGAQGKPSAEPAAETADAMTTETDDNTETGERDDAEEAPANASAARTGQPVAANEEMEEMKRRVWALEEQSEADALEIEDLKERMDQQDDNAMEDLKKEARELKLYGFLDVQWYKIIVFDDTLQDGYLNHWNTFMVGRWNFFLEKQISDYFRVLGEVRFLFQPYGQILTYGSPLGDEYSTANTTATDWADAFDFNWGGIAIERAWVEFKPADYFGLRVGYFLSPFGLWNEDHSFTVVIPAHRPRIITSRLLPLQQTGLSFFGRVFPGDRSIIEYGLTLSNGRGPVAEFYDLDENKAIGLKLNYSFDGPVHFNIGTYLFMGDYTAVATNIVSFEPFDYEHSKTVEYSEKAISLHVKLEWAGLLIQGEYVRGMVKYEESSREFAIYGPDVVYSPDYVQQGTYALLRYRLPFEAVNIGPYFMYEYTEPAPLAGKPIGHNLCGGINWHINPFVIWKLEYNHTLVPSKEESLAKFDFGIVITQLAVAY
jgi:hypothetical protein